MQAYLFIAPPSIDKGACSNQNISVGPWVRWSNQRGILQCRTRVSASAISGSRQNHYSVLGVCSNASSTDIKKAYRLLALKYHPDVNKDSGADDVFKKIRLSYEIVASVPGLPDMGIYRRSALATEYPDMLVCCCTPLLGHGGGKHVLFPGFGKA